MFLSLISIQRIIFAVFSYLYKIFQVSNSSLFENVNDLVKIDIDCDVIQREEIHYVKIIYHEAAKQ